MVVNTLGFGKQRLVAEIIKQSYNVEDPNSIKLGMKDILYIIQEMQDNAGRKYIEGHKKLGGSFQVFNNFAYHLLYRNLANYDSMLLVTSEKGCLTDDTIIITNKHPNGIKIKHVDYKNYKVLSFNKQTELFEFKDCDGIEFVKEDDIYEILLENGDDLEGTKDHPILTTQGYKQLIDCKGLNVYTTKGILKCINVSITPHKRKVYDVVNVRDNHNFIANGFIVSNTGKSSFSIMLARAWCQLLGMRFDPKRHLAYSNRDVMNKISTLQKFEPIVMDEAVRFACLDGKTIINTKQGLFKIEDLEGKENFEVLSYNINNNKYEYKNAGKCIKTKEDCVYEIETECGKKIKATKEHKFLTDKGWKKLEDLKEGDELL